VKVLNLGTWNVRTLLDNSKADRPERRTALVARELARYNVDIAALEETRLADKGQLTEQSGGYTFFWSGRASTERREAGVGFAVKSHLARKLAKLPEGINDRLMTLQLPLGNKKNATLISAYAPTMTNPDDIKDKFYEELDALIAAVPQSEKLFILGDFNARVGTDYQTWEGVIGRHGVGKCNSNGLLLLQTCTAHDLVITNTLFRLPTRNRTSWMHPRSRHWHLIDYVITRKKDRQDVRVTRSMCGADCWTDHRLIVSKCKLRIQPARRPQGQKTAKRLNISKLKSSIIADKLSSDMDARLPDTPDDQTSIEEQWTVFRDTVHTCALEHLGPATRRNQDWFDENNEEIQTLLAEKHQLFRAHQNDPSSQAKKDAFTSARQKVQKKLREMQDSWYSAKADEIQGYADSNNTKRFYDALKAVYGPQPTGSSPLLTADGTQLLTEKKQILERWAEHFDQVLNRPAAINEEAIARLPQVEINNDLDNPPTEDEVSKAIKQLSCGKAPGSDAIPAEVYKAGGPAMLQNLTMLFQAIWRAGEVPQQWKDASIVHIYKRKGDRQQCDNHRGISLLSIAGKILARVLLNRLLLHLEQGLLPESQCGFRAERGTVDMIFAARQLQEKCQEQHSDLFVTFVDLTKAFDTVSREGLWKIMEKFGCPSTFVTIVRQFHDGMMVKVLDDGDESEAFPVTNGVKQGCVLAPTLFSMVFSAMLTDAFQGSQDGVRLRYRTDGRLFNLRRMQAITKVKETVIRDLLFADDCALNAPTEQKMQHEMNCLSEACNNFGLTISTKKTEVLYQPAPGKPYHEPNITVNGQKLQAVDKFTYLGSTLSRAVNIDAEINNRVAKASAAFGRLRENVWERRGLSRTTKLKVYRAVVLTTLLYACETWTVYSRHAKQLNHFHTSCLRRLLHIRWQDKVPDTEVLERAGLPSIFTILQKMQVRWTGHVIRMQDHRLPKQLLYGELSQGKRTAGGQKKRYKDSLKASLKALGLDLSTWETLALDRPAWRSNLTRGAHAAELERTAYAENKRAARKARAASTPTTVPTHMCPTCGRAFRARIGLTSHLRTHRPRSPN
jgi:hypothetical protein